MFVKPVFPHDLAAAVIRQRQTAGRRFVGQRTGVVGQQAVVDIHIHIQRQMIRRRVLPRGRGGDGIRGQLKAALGHRQFLIRYAVAQILHQPIGRRCGGSGVDDRVAEIHNRHIVQNNGVLAARPLFVQIGQREVKRGGFFKFHRLPVGGDGLHPLIQRVKFHILGGIKPQQQPVPSALQRQLVERPAHFVIKAVDIPLDVDLAIICLVQQLLHIAFGVVDIHIHIQRQIFHRRLAGARRIDHLGTGAVAVAIGYLPPPHHGLQHGIHILWRIRRSKVRFRQRNTG